MSSGGENLKMNPCVQEIAEKTHESEELLMKKKENLKKKIKQELQFVRNNSRKNKKAALQALRRKRIYDKTLKYIEGAMKDMMSVHEHTDVTDKVKNVTKELAEHPDKSEDISDNLYACMSPGLEFDEDELLAELERLEKNLDESLFEKEKKEERDCRPEEVTTAPNYHPAKTEDDEIEEALEYLRCWAHDSS